MPSPRLRLMLLFSVTALLYTAPAAAQAPAAKPQSEGESAKSALSGGPHASFLGFQAPVPPAWTAETPASSMRVAQYRVPAAPGAEPGDLIVYYFGAGQGGSVEANIARWRSQFSTRDSKPVEPVVTKMQADKMPVTVTELRGDYARGVGMGPGGAVKPDQMLLAAIVEAPQGSIIVQLHGPAATVSAQRQAFLTFVQGIRPAGR